MQATYSIDFDSTPLYFEVCEFENSRTQERKFIITKVTAKCKFKDQISQHDEIILANNAPISSLIDLFDMCQRDKMPLKLTFSKPQTTEVYQEPHLSWIVPGEVAFYPWPIHSTTVMWPVDIVSTPTSLSEPIIFKFFGSPPEEVAETCRQFSPFIPGLIKSMGDLGDLADGPDKTLLTQSLKDALRKFIDTHADFTEEVVLSYMPKRLSKRVKELLAASQTFKEGDVVEVSYSEKFAEGETFPLYTVVKVLRNGKYKVKNVMDQWELGPRALRLATHAEPAEPKRVPVPVKREVSNEKTTRKRRQPSESESQPKRTKAKSSSTTKTSSTKSSSTAQVPKHKLLQSPSAPSNPPLNHKLLHSTVTAPLNHKLLHPPATSDPKAKKPKTAHKQLNSSETKVADPAPTTPRNPIPNTIDSLSDRLNLISVSTSLSFDERAYVLSRLLIHLRWNGSDAVPDLVDTDLTRVVPIQRPPTPEEASLWYGGFLQTLQPHPLRPIVIQSSGDPNVRIVENLSTITHAPQDEGMVGVMEKNVIKFKLAMNPFVKLRSAYDQANGGNRACLATRLMGMLTRYELIRGGTGVHWQCPLNAMKDLRDILQVNSECFSSPLHFCMPNYCSPFSVFDCYFNSKGSFYEYFPSEGSHQAFPPLASDYSDVEEHILLLLTEAKAALSFTLVLHGGMCPQRVALQNPGLQQFVSCSFYLEGSAHTFVEDFRHEHHERIHVLPERETLVCILQNPAGKDMYKWNPDLEPKLRRSFQKGIRTARPASPAFQVKLRT